MPEKSHWPFGTGSSASSRQSRRHGEKAANIADQSALRQRARFDRLLVGGRAHTKKHGLS